jgi:hypothetical protein
MIVAGMGIPSLATYKEYTEKASRGEGGVSRHGYRNCPVLWQKMTRAQAAALRRYVDDAGLGLLYLTVQRLDGSNPTADWIDISGYPDLSDIAATAPMLFEGSHMHQNVLLTLNNVTVVNENPVF